ncbi:MAG: hypothetical protein MUC83_17740 [Pirellula sp.]|nr:hypothetical protein [Pirellula sp.]
MGEDPNCDSSICVGQSLVAAIKRSAEPTVDSEARVHHYLRSADLIWNPCANGQLTGGIVRQRGTLNQNADPCSRLDGTSVVGWFTLVAMLCIYDWGLAGIGNAQGASSQPLQDIAMLRYLHGISLAKQSLDDGDPFIAEKRLQALDPKLRGWEWNLLARRTRAELKFLSLGPSQEPIYGSDRFLDVTCLSYESASTGS